MDTKIEPDRFRTGDVELYKENEAFEHTDPLLSEDEEDRSHTRQSSASVMTFDRRTKMTILVSSITTIIVMLSIWTLWTQVHGSHMPKPFIYDIVLGRNQPGVTSCGNTVEEAKALGCTFDELADLWLPQRCSRTYASQYAESNNGVPFKYWADKEGRYEIFNRSLYVGEEIYWSTTRDHLVHCVFNMYRFAHSLRYGSVIGHDGTFSGHVEHCASLLGQYAVLAPDIDNIDVETQSGFGYC